MQGFLIFLALFQAIVISHKECTIQKPQLLDYKVQKLPKINNQIIINMYIYISANHEQVDMFLRHFVLKFRLILIVLHEINSGESH